MVSENGFHIVYSRIIYNRIVGMFFYIFNLIF